MKRTFFFFYVIHSLFQTSSTAKTVFQTTTDKRIKMLRSHFSRLGLNRCWFYSSRRWVRCLDGSRCRFDWDSKSSRLKRWKDKLAIDFHGAEIFGLAIIVVATNKKIKSERETMANDGLAPTVRHLLLIIIISVRCRSIYKPKCQTCIHSLLRRAIQLNKYASSIRRHATVLSVSIVCASLWKFGDEKMSKCIINLIVYKIAHLVCKLSSVRNYKKLTTRIGLKLS